MSLHRILLADDHTLFREGVNKLLGAEADLRVVGEAANAGEAVGKAAELHPDLVLIDVAMPGLSSFEAARQIKKQRPETKVVFLTMYDDEDYLVAGMEAGANGYLLKDCPAAQLISAVREVCRGGSSLSSRMLSHLVDDFRGRVKGEALQPRFGTLTSREREVLKLLAEGQSVKDIAGQLGLSIKTIEVHKFNLMRKLDIHNQAHLVHYAIQTKIIEIDSATLAIDSIPA
jgi:two-component system, NarL family, response regulator NreC